MPSTGPIPCKAIWPPIKKGDKEWRDYYEQCDARTPLHYLNAGIWPMIGGFYVVSLVKLKKWKEAKIELKRLAEANMKKHKIRDHKEGHEFNEWLDGAHGNAKGEPYQAWSAGSYIYAYECLKRRKVLFF
jgi:glycogen debranching enzyme